MKVNTNSLFCLYNLILSILVVIFSYSDLLSQCTPAIGNNGPLCIGQDLKLSASGVDSSFAGANLILSSTTSDYIEATGFSGILGTHARTVEAWIKTTVANNGIIMSWGTSGSGRSWRM